MDDQQIVALYWSRSESAITQTQAKYGRYCHYIAYQILGNDADAEEIVNDTFLKAWNTIPPNRPATLRAFMGMITRQLSLNAWEARNAQKRAGALSGILDELADCIADSGDLAETVALRDALNRFLWALPLKTRNIFLRRYWYASSISEIAKDYAMTQNHVAVLLFNTRKKLRKFLNKEGFAL